MNGNFLKPVALSTCFLFISLFANLNGKWKGVLNTPNGSIPVVYNFKINGDTLTGTAQSQQGSVNIDSGKVEGNNFSFDVTVDGTVYPHFGKVYDDSCSLNVDFGYDTVHTTLIRDTTR